MKLPPASWVASSTLPILSSRASTLNPVRSMFGGVATVKVHISIVAIPHLPSRLCLVRFLALSGSRSPTPEGSSQTRARNSSFVRHFKQFHDRRPVSGGRGEAQLLACEQRPEARPRDRIRVPGVDLAPDGDELFGLDDSGLELLVRG